MKIIKLEAENIKGLKAIEISPTGDFVEIAGKNGAGKSSVLDAIWLALGGKEAAKNVHTALRNGTENGYVDLDLGTLKVRRTFTAEGTTRLTVKAVHDGIESSVNSPQTTLDALRAVALDPAGFIDLTPREQRDALLEIIDLGLDLDEWASERKAVFDERTEVGRELRALGEIPAIDDTLPKQEQSAGELIDKIREIEQANRARDAADQEVQHWADEVFKTTEEISRLTQLLEEQANAHAEAQKRLAEFPELRSTLELEAQLTTVEETNAKIRTNNGTRDLLARKAALTDQRDNLTTKLDNLDETKEAAIAAASIGLEGLSIGEEGITYDGVPFQDLNSGAQIEVAFWVLAELNPRLRIVQIRHGSLLDEDAVSKIKSLAAENNFQLWVETVGTGSEDAIIIEAGEIK